MYCNENADFFTSSLRGPRGRRPAVKKLRRLVRDLVRGQQTFGHRTLPPMAPPMPTSFVGRGAYAADQCSFGGTCTPCGSDIAEYTNNFSSVCCSTQGQCGTDITPLTNCFPGCCRPGCERSCVWPYRT